MLGTVVRWADDGDDTAAVALDLNHMVCEGGSKGCPSGSHMRGPAVADPRVWAPRYSGVFPRGVYSVIPQRRMR